MDKLKIFKNERFGEVRIAGTGEQPLFCLADICRVLEIKNPSDCKSRLKQDGVVLTEVTDSLGKTQEATFINEQNLYKVIMRSDKPQAEPFQDWVCGEVLPSIRKNGIYATSDFIEQALNNPDTMIAMLTKLKQEREARAEAEKQVAILTHVNKTYTCTEIAKELGMKSAIELNNRLKELGIQYKVNKTWVPYTKYSTLGWFDIKQEVADNGHIIYHRRITGIGRKEIINLLSR